MFHYVPQNNSIARHTTIELYSSLIHGTTHTRLTILSSIQISYDGELLRCVAEADTYTYEDIQTGYNEADINITVTGNHRHEY